MYCPDDEPTREPLSKLEFEFENKNLNKEQIKDLIYEEILLYHFPEFKKQYLEALKSGKGILEHIENNANKEFTFYEKEDEGN